MNTTPQPQARSRDLRRTELGPKFNEGARLLWLAIIREGITQFALSRELGIATPGVQNRWLWGDQRPMNPWRKKINERFSVPVDAWDEEPTEAFTPPLASAGESPDAAPCSPDA